VTALSFGQGRRAVRSGSGGAANFHVDGLRVAYGKIVAVPDLTFTVPAGGVLAILGPNGAGKTTTANALAGLIPSTARSVKIGDMDIKDLSADRRVLAGLGHLPDQRAVFPSLTVIDNLRMAFTLESSSARIREKIQEAYERFPSLERRRNIAAGQLSGGEQQMLAAARLVVDPPRVLMLDEPSHGLAPLIVSSIFEAFRRVRGKTTILIIEQFVSRALELADDVIVLSHGTLIHQGPARDLTPEMAADLYRLQ
jgi:branched-chain amino acid transport system ATP-binding protein